MRENTVPEIAKIINEAVTPVLILVVGNACNEETPRIQEDLEKRILEVNRAVAMFTVCMPEGSISFPRPQIPALYYFLPNNQIPVFWRGNDMIQHIAQDLEIVEKMFLDGVSHEDARYDDTMKTQIRDTETAFAQETTKEFPPKLKQARNFIKEMWTTARRGMNNLPVIATAEEGGRRLDICETCPSFESSSNRCKECGCAMNIKTQLVASTCPLGKW